MNEPRDRPALIGVAHGSRNPDAATHTERIVQETGRLLGVEAHAAYLESFASPQIGEVAGQLAHHGYSHAIAVPLLFTVAYHATEDTPEAITEASREHGITITQSEVLGTGDDLVGVLLTHLYEHESGRETSAESPILLLGVGSSREGANPAVEDLGARLAQATGREVTVRFATSEPRVRDFFNQGPEPGVMLPLFTAPGKLLDWARRDAEAAHWRTLPHLGTSLAPLVAARYQHALAHLHS